MMASDSLASRRARTKHSGITVHLGQYTFPPSTQAASVAATWLKAIVCLALGLVERTVSCAIILHWLVCNAEMRGPIPPRDDGDSC
ncbi:unnamed protein product [Protopolystoma xenopodis]|uniref:Uncharacterized protein n=1 Tax=Protopolystoma xenopodis TaxID=117903 RepID=A0A448WL62_9PLAT|nr:unnamed protein product [Protopolystoma xenopodis]